MDTTDLAFNLNTRDIDTENAITTNASVQNAGIIKEARCFSPLQPVWGIGLGNIINSPVGKVNFEMNRWKDQMVKDGAFVARFTINQDNGNGNTKITIGIESSY